MTQIQHPPYSPPRTTVASYPRYADAQKAVDTLSDEGFPVEKVDIVWRGLRLTEHVTGRRTIATAARDGAVSGAWFGAVLAFLLGLFVQFDDGVSYLGVLATYALLGAAFGALTLAVGHWLRRGRRDFDAVSAMEAEEYLVQVDHDHSARAATMLGSSFGTTRPMDP